MLVSCSMLALLKRSHRPVGMGDDVRVEWIGDDISGTLGATPTLTANIRW
jgi:hypothetical protein